MNDLEKQGYAEKVPEADLDIKNGKVCYIIRTMEPYHPQSSIVLSVIKESLLIRNSYKARSYQQIAWCPPQVEERQSVYNGRYTVNALSGESYTKPMRHAALLVVAWLGYHQRASSLQNASPSFVGNIFS